MFKSTKNAIKAKAPVVALGLRIKADVKEALDKAAADDDRSINSYAERALAAHLREKGYLK